MTPGPATPSTGTIRYARHSKAMDSAHKRQPGEAILDRYMPEATAEERETARESLRRLAQFILRVESRIVTEAREREIRTAEEDTLKSDSRLLPPV